MRPAGVAVRGEGGASPPAPVLPWPRIFTIALYNFDRYGIQNLRKQDVEKRRDEFEAHYSRR